MEKLLQIWTEEMHEKLIHTQEQISASTRADYHKGYAEGMLAGVSYAMAILSRTERQLRHQVPVEDHKAPQRSFESSEKNNLKAYESISANTEPVIKRVIAFKCEHCGDEGVIFQDPNKPLHCTKCGKDHIFKDLERASYFCECGKICKFMIEPTVTKVKCHCCATIHHMKRSEKTGAFYSLNNRERQTLPKRPEHPLNAVTAQPNTMHVNRKPKSNPMVKRRVPLQKQELHINTCLECGEEFMSYYESCVTCDNCAGGKKHGLQSL